MDTLQSLDNLDGYTDMPEAMSVMEIGDRLAKDIIAAAIDCAMVEDAVDQNSD